MCSLGSTSRRVGRLTDHRRYHRFRWRFGLGRSSSTTTSPLLPSAFNFQVSRSSPSSSGTSAALSIIIIRQSPFFSIIIIDPYSRQHPWLIPPLYWPKLIVACSFPIKSRLAHMHLTPTHKTTRFTTTYTTLLPPIPHSHYYDPPI